MVGSAEETRGTKSADLNADQVHQYLDDAENISAIRNFLDAALADDIGRESLFKPFEHLLSLKQELLTRRNLVLTVSRGYVSLFARHAELFIQVSTIQYYLRSGPPRGFD